MNATYEGIVEKFDRLYINKDGEMGESTKKRVDLFTSEVHCPTCDGTRLSQQTLSCKINGYHIADYTARQIDDLIPLLKEITDSVAMPMIDSIVERLQHLVDIGLDYVSLGRETTTLSGGE